MNISNIKDVLPFTFTLPGHEDNSGSSPAVLQDVIDLNIPDSLTDEEADEILNASMQMIVEDPLSALTVHVGLTPERVQSLLSLA